MIKRKSLLLVFSVLAYLVIVALPVSAEWFADFHVGPAFTQDDDISVNAPGLSANLSNVEYDNSVSLGGRFGHWFDWYEAFPYLGLAIDVSHFRPDIDRQNVGVDVSAAGLGAAGTLILNPIDVSVTEISFDAMLRYPLLVTKEFPNGQVQPYFSIGPSIFVAKADPTGVSSDTDTSAGVKVGPGVAWQFHRNVAVFGEYRFTHFSPDFDFSGVKVETDANTHRVVFGVSLRF